MSKLYDWQGAALQVRETSLRGELNPSTSQNFNDADARNPKLFN